MNFQLLNGHVPVKILVELKGKALLFGLTSDIRLAHFLSQVSHESGGFLKTEENLNYSEKRLLQVFPKYFNERNSIYYANKPEKIGSRVYASRMGNRDEKSGDGYWFRGRGYLQLTGAENYVAFGKAVNENLVKFPDLVSVKYPLTSALFFFNTNNLWSICDEGSTEDTVKKLTKRINGGTIGLKHRVAEFNKFAKILKIIQ